MVNDPQPPQEQERLLVVLAYGLYLLSIAGGLPLLAGFIIALVRLPHARGTVYESHYRNIILVFFAILAFMGVVIATALAVLFNLLLNVAGHAALVFWQWPLVVTLIPVAALMSLLLGLWFFWRVLRGLVHVLDDKPY